MLYLQGYRSVTSVKLSRAVNFACKHGPSFNVVARVTPAVGLPYLLVNRVLVKFKSRASGVELFKDKTKAVRNICLQEKYHISINFYNQGWCYNRPPKDTASPVFNELTLDEPAMTLKTSIWSMVKFKNHLITVSYKFMAFFSFPVWVCGSPLGGCLGRRSSATVKLGNAVNVRSRQCAIYNCFISLFSSLDFENILKEFKEI